MAELHSTPDEDRWVKSARTLEFFNTSSAYVEDDTSMGILGVIQSVDIYQLDDNNLLIGFRRPESGELRSLEFIKDGDRNLKLRVVCGNEKDANPPLFYKEIANITKVQFYADRHLSMALVTWGEEKSSCLITSQGRIVYRSPEDDFETQDLTD